MFFLLNRLLRNTLGFSKTESNGSIVLIVLVILVAIVPRILLNEIVNTEEKVPVDPESLKSWKSEIEASLVKKNTPVRMPAFKFNPNFASGEELKRLGFTDKTAGYIIRYRAAGGKFNIKGDLKKIYGISQQRVEKLWGYIDLPETRRQTVVSKHPVPATAPDTATTRIRKADLNTTTADQLIKIRGIGPVLSERIIKYRELLGGFAHKAQLYEVYGLDSATVEKIADRFELRSMQTAGIPLNTDSVRHLAEHPYIDWHTARVIFNYRQVHGDFSSFSQLKDIKIISDSLYQKIYPYLSLNPVR